MAISDVQQALLNVGTISKADVATVVFDGTSTVSAQASWEGARGFSGYKDVVFQAVSGDTTGTLINYALVTNSGIANFTTGTIVAYDPNYAIFFDTGNYYMVATKGLSQNDGSLFPITDFGTSGSYTAPPPVCFAEGSHIRTERGEIAVEDLVEGDQVHVLESGAIATRKVTWIGHRDINLASHPDPFEAQPIRIRRDAFAKGVPCRDLLVSPDHAVLVDRSMIRDGALIPDGVLVPARLLVNGASVVRETRLTKIRYFHVELDRHSIIFSENLPSESYLDTGNRSFFQNGGSVIDLNVGFVGHDPVVARETLCCRPFVYAERTVLPIWQQIASRAEQLGYRAPAVATTADPALRIGIDGRLFQPLRISDDIFSFVLPPEATEVRLVSNAARPCDAKPWVEDHRVLGVSVSRIRIRDGNEVTEVALDGPALGRGWWAVEGERPHNSRWTNGDAVLQLPEARGPRRLLELQVGGDILYPIVTKELQPDARIA